MNYGLLTTDYGPRSLDAGAGTFQKFFWLPAFLVYTELGQINDQQIVPLSSAKSLDYRNLAQASAEIRGHATRIKFYSPLGLNDRTGAKIRFEADASQLGAMLPRLSRAITSFRASPVFRGSAPNDAELRSVAAHDLEGIIKLSDTINKIAKRLSKPMVANNENLITE